MSVNVLVPLDGSDKDERALSVAAALLELTEGRARVVQVARPGEPASVATVQEAEEWLEGNALRETTSEILNGSDVPGILLADIETHHANFVVMATRAAGPIG